MSWASKPGFKTTLLVIYLASALPPETWSSFNANVGTWFSGSLIIFRTKTDPSLFKSKIGATNLFIEDKLNLNCNLLPVLFGTVLLVSSGKLVPSV